MYGITYGVCISASTPPAHLASACRDATGAGLGALWFRGRCGFVVGGTRTDTRTHAHTHTRDQSKEQGCGEEEGVGRLLGPGGRCVVSPSDSGWILVERICIRSMIEGACPKMPSSAQLYGVRSTIQL